MPNATMQLKVSLLVFLATLIPLAVGAQQAPLAPVHEFGLSAGVSYFDYEEDSVDIGIDGPMYGIAARYDFHSPASRWMFGLQGELDYGRTEYDGAFQTGEPVTEDSDDLILELRALTGVDFEPGPGWLLTPYVGLGYRYWYNDIEGPGSYTREVHYFYLPVGLEINRSIGGGWRVRLTAEGDVLLSGQVDSELSDLDPGFNDTTNETDLGDGWGARVSLEARTDRFSIEPYFKYWDIDDSDLDALTYYGFPTGLAFYEPANTTTVVGIRVGFYF
ncbi:MAG: outer membrane beta-barrel protein [Desulfobacterales bacterium]